jgi:hypothetical protein
MAPCMRGHTPAAPYQQHTVSAAGCAPRAALPHSERHGRARAAASVARTPLCSPRCVDTGQQCTPQHDENGGTQEVRSQGVQHGSRLPSWPVGHRRGTGSSTRARTRPRRRRKRNDTTTRRHTMQAATSMSRVPIPFSSQRAGSFCSTRARRQGCVRDTRRRLLLRPPAAALRWPGSAAAAHQPRPQTWCDSVLPSSPSSRSKPPLGEFPRGHVGPTARCQDCAFTAARPSVLHDTGHAAAHETPRARPPARGTQGCVGERPPQHAPRRHRGQRRLLSALRVSGADTRRCSSSE